MGNKSVKLLDVVEEWRDARTRLKELEVVANCEIVYKDHGPAKKVVVFHSRHASGCWLRMELGPHTWDFIDHSVARGEPVSPLLAITTDEAFEWLRVWLQSHKCL